MQIDSGADVTLIPRSAASRVRVSPIPDLSYEIAGFNGEISSAAVVELEMVFLSRAFRGRFLLTEDATGILGRDVLNHLALLLDGPRLMWCEQRAPQV